MYNFSFFKDQHDQAIVGGNGEPHGGREVEEQWQHAILSRQEKTSNHSLSV